MTPYLLRGKFWRQWNDRASDDDDLQPETGRAAALRAHRGRRVCGGGGVPGAVLAAQSPEIYELGTQLLGAAGVAVAAGALAALDKAVRTRFGSWLGVVRIG